MNTATTTLPAPVSTAALPVPGRSRRLALLALAILGLAAGALYGHRRIAFALVHESTDNAQVEGHISPVLPRLPGYVARVLVNDNDRVAAGQTLVVIDPADLDLKIANAEAARHSAQAALRIAEASLSAARAAGAVAAANVDTAAVVQAKATADLARDEGLARTGTIPAQQRTDARATAESTAAQLVAVRRQADAAAAQIAVAEAGIAAARAQADERAADLDYARLQRSYATIAAPIAGIVSHKNVEPGQYVQAGQTLLSIAANTDLWLVANFKETQVARMQAGQTVAFTIDGYPGRSFHGRVDSLSGATGARFALLPPDNASGNFVKVTQRVPVKIVPDDAAAAAGVLRTGMSVNASVRVRD